MRQFAALSALTATLLCSFSTVKGETLTVKLSGLHAGAGVVRVMIWKDASGFPTRPEKAIARKVLPVSGPDMEVRFTGVPAGVYAVAAYQDENNNAKLDLSFFGWPTEPTAASNGATGMLGPPSFSDAAFALKLAEQTIDLHFK